jgi:hypothetical protein
MAEQRKSNSTSREIPDGKQIGDEQTDIAGTDEGRRQMLNLLRKAAVAAPVVMTLTTSPARASTGSSYH